MNKEELQKRISKAGNILQFSDGCKFLVSALNIFADSISENFPDDSISLCQSDIEYGPATLNLDTLKIENSLKSYDEEPKDKDFISHFHGKLEKVYEPKEYNIFKVEGGEDITLEEKGIMFDFNKEDYNGI